jgi:hypothetical protein
MTTHSFVTTPDAVAPTAERLEVDALVHLGETPTIPEYVSPQCISGFIILLSADPNPGGEEPIEDAYGGLVQDLSCAHAF